MAIAQLGSPPVPTLEMVQTAALGSGWKLKIIIVDPTARNCFSELRKSPGQLWLPDVMWAKASAYFEALLYCALPNGV
jgi:hypothetical protein